MSITISDTTPRVQYTAANTQTAFSVPFEFFNNGDLVVIKTSGGTDTTLTYNASPPDATKYSVAGAGVSGGGSITLGANSTNGDIYTIYRELPISRTTDFSASGSFPVETLNTELDKIVAMSQQLERDLKLSPKALATTANTFNLTFPNLVANKILSVNSAGNALEFDQSVTDVATVAGIASNVTTVAGISANVTTVAGIAANVTAVAGDATDIGAVAGKATEIGLLGTSDAITDMNTLGTSAIVTDMDLLGTSANVTAMGHLGTSANVTAMGLLGTSAVVTDMGLLGTADVVTDMNVLGTADVVSDMNTLATSAIVTDMDLLATSANVTAMGLLGNSTTVTNMGLLGTSAVITDMGLLGTSAVIADMAQLATSDIISDMNTLATSDIIADLNTLATSDIVTDMNLLATSANVTAMGLLGVSGVITDMGLLGTSAVVTDMDLLGTSANVTNMATLGASGVVANIATTAGAITNVNNVGGAITNINSVASNLSSVNNFADVYRIASSAPSSSLTAGDLYFNTSTDILSVYGGSGWQNAGSSVNGTSARFKFVATSNQTTFTGNDSAGTSLSYDSGYIDVYLNGVHLDPTDYTASNGTSIVLGSGASTGDILYVVGFGTFNVASIASSAIANDLIDSQHYASASIDLEHMSSESVDEDNLYISNAGSNGQYLSKQSGNNGGLTWATVDTTIADDSIVEAKLDVSNAPTNGQFLQAQSGEGGGLTWAVPTDTNTTYSVQDGELSQINFTSADNSKLDGIASSANNYTHPNHSGEVTSTNDGATVVADNIVDEANLKVSNSPTNGYMLTAQSGNTGGLTWAEAGSGGLVPLASTRSTSSVADIAIAEFGDQTLYAYYKVFMRLLPSDNDVHTHFRFRNGATSNLNDANYRSLYHWVTNNIGGMTTGTVSTGWNTASPALWNNQSAIDCLIEADLIFKDTSLGMTYNMITGTGYVPHRTAGSTNSHRIVQFSNVYNGDTQADGFYMWTSSGTFSKHDVQVYGVKKN